MKQPEKIKYIDVINLGFKIEDAHDNAFFNINGYDYKIISLQLKNRVTLDWSQETHLVEMYKCDKKHNVLERTTVQDLETVKELIRFFGKKSK